MGNSYRKLKNYEDAVASYQKAVAINPKIANSWKYLGIICIFINEWNTSVDCLEKFLKMKSDDAEAWAFLSLAYEQQNRYAYALSAIDNAIKLAPNVESFTKARQRIAEKLN